jgi:hypothetical protein
MQVLPVVRVHHRLAVAAGVRASGELHAFQQLNETRRLNKNLEASHLGCPIRSVLASCTVLGLDTHQLGNLTEECAREMAPVQCCPDMLNSLLEGSPLVPELSDLVQKDPDLTGKSFREIVDISTFDRSVTRSRRSLEKSGFGGAPLAL